VALSGPPNEPPVAGHNITVFPARDFVSAEGYQQDETVTVEVHHVTRGGNVVSSTSGIVPLDDPDTDTFDGIVEVNHPGGACWVGVTPNIVPGDLVRVVVDSSPDPARVGVADQTTVADVTAGRPSSPEAGTVVVHGTASRPALDAAGNPTAEPIPLDQLEQRLVAPNQLFRLGGKRTLRAPGTPRATLAYDAPGSTSWTATYTGLTAPDVDRALGAESRAMWLGRDPLGATEATIFENGAGVVGGPATPDCTAPAERLAPLPGQDAEAPTVPANLTAAVSDDNVVTLSWDAATDNVAVSNYGVYRNGVPVWTVQSPDGGTSPVPTTFVDRNVPPGTYAYTVDAADALDNRSAESDPARAVTTAKPADAIPVNEPPLGGHEITLFPSRDFMDAAGYALDETLNVQVIRNGQLVSESTGLVPDEAGAVEVNHPGGGCWVGTTPELRTNDKVRVLAYGPDGTLRSADQTTVGNVVAKTAVKVADDDPATPEGEGVVTVQGRAAGHDGAPLPLDQLEQRLVASSAEPFGRSGKRTLRADSTGAGEGSLAYDTVDNSDGTRWTATYTGLDAADVALALSVESRVMWLGVQPLSGAELTIFEVGLADPPGPATPDCTAPLEPIDTVAPSQPVLSATADGATKTVALHWTAAEDDTYVYGYRVYRDGKALRAVPGDTTQYTDTGVGPGRHTYAVEAFDSASPHGAGANDPARLTAGLGEPYGNVSVRSADQSVSLPDVTKPSAPANLTATNEQVTNATTGVTSERVKLTWDPSTDDTAVTSYRLYRDAVALNRVIDPAPNANGKVVFNDNNRTPGATYTYRVTALDAAGNESPASGEVTVTIGPDSEAPTTPQNLKAATGQHGEKQVSLTWDPAADNVGVTQYGVYRDGTRIATVAGSTPGYVDTVPAAATYAYRVDAVDSVGNRSVRTPVLAVVVADEPPRLPHAITAFPSRDFVEAAGYTAAEAPVRVSVLRGGVTISTSTAATPVGGLVEVNHAGGACWTGNTPDIRPGDVVRVTTAQGVAEQVTVSNVTAQRPAQTASGTIVVRGTAADAAGRPLPLDQLEQRLVSGGNEFAKNGRRTLRAAVDGDGTLAYDAAGSTSWTATFTGLNAADVNRAIDAESRVLWLGRDPLAGNEVTIYENGPGVEGGPGVPDCTAPMEPNRPVASWTPARLGLGDVSAAPPATGPAKPVTYTNAGGVPLTLTKVYVAGANPGDFAATSAKALPYTLAPGEQVAVNVTFSPKAVGARAASVSFVSDAANTQFQTVELTGNGTDAAAPSAPGRPAVALAVGQPLGTTTVPVSVSWAPSATGTLTHYELQQSVGTGAFATVPVEPQTATSVVRQLTPANYRFQVRGCNGVNCSAWVATAAATNLTALQENAKDVAFGGTWSGNVAVAGAFGGNVRNSSTVGSKAQVKFTASSVQFVSTKGPDRGVAEIWINGVRVATVDLYAPELQARQVVFTRTGLPASQTQLEVRVVARAGSTAATRRVDVDAFLTMR
jgi:fibronectin type 3 domain-containing protein